MRKLEFVDVLNLGSWQLNELRFIERLRLVDVPFHQKVVHSTLMDCWRDWKLFLSLGRSLNQGTDQFWNSLFGHPIVVSIQKRTVGIKRVFFVAGRALHMQNGSSFWLQNLEQVTILNLVAYIDKFCAVMGDYKFAEERVEGLHDRSRGGLWIGCLSVVAYTLEDAFNSFMSKLAFVKTKAVFNFFKINTCDLKCKVVHLLVHKVADELLNYEKV